MDIYLHITLSYKYGIIFISKDTVPRKEKTFMLDYSKMTDEEFNRINFIDADSTYIDDVIRKSKDQIKSGKYKVIVSANGIDESGSLGALQCS